MESPFPEATGIMGLTWNMRLGKLCKETITFGFKGSSFGRASLLSQVQRITLQSLEKVEGGREAAYGNRIRPMGKGHAQCR